MPIDKADIGPAISELRDAYQKVLVFLDDYDKTHGNKGMNYASKMPVVGIAPKGRRKEQGWFKPGSWESDIMKGFGKLAPISANQKIHGEVFLAGEILGEDAEDIVKVLIHQAFHQVSGTESNTSYHTAVYANAAKHYGVKATTVEGWGFTDLTYPQAWRDFIAQTAASLDKNHFDVHRMPEGEVNEGIGKMLLWYCHCGRPKMRTGAIPVMTCDICHHPLMMADKKRLDPNDATSLDPLFIRKFDTAMARKGFHHRYQDPASTIFPRCKEEADKYVLAPNGRGCIYHQSRGLPCV